MATSSTRLLIEMAMLRILREFDEVVGLLDVPLVTTAVGTTTTLKATALGRGSSNAGMYNARQIKIAELVTNGPAVGEIAGVNTGGFDSDQILTVSPAFTGTAVQSGTDVLIYPRGFSPETLVDAINEVLRNTEAPHLHLVTLGTDADMEASGTTSYTATTATLTKDTTAANVRFGAQSMRMQGNGGAPRAQGVSINVDANQTLFCLANGRVASGTAKLVLWDVTNDRQIGDVAPTSTQRGWMELAILSADVPAGCKQVAVRLEGTGATDDIYWDSWTILPFMRVNYDLPSWLLSAASIRDVLYLPSLTLGSESDVYQPYEREFLPFPYWSLERDDRAATAIRLNIPPLWNHPIYLDVMRPFSEVTTDTGTTTADVDYVAEKAVANILYKRNDDRWKTWATRAAARARHLGYGQRTVRMVEGPSVLLGGERDGMQPIGSLRRWR